MLTYSGKWYDVLRSRQAVYNFICIGIASSLIFWPLLNSIFSGLLLLYWFSTSGKTFSLANGGVKKAVLFASLYLVVLLGITYSSDSSESLFRLGQKSAILIFPLVFGTVAIVTPMLSSRILWALVFSTIVGCIYCLTNGLIVFFSQGKTDELFGYTMVVLKDMHPAVFGLCCLLSLAFILNQLYHKTSAVTENRALAYGGIVFLAVFIFLIGNRNNLFCLLIVLGYYFIKIFNSILTRSTAIIFLICFSVVTIYFIPGLRERWNEVVSMQNPESKALSKSDQEMNMSGKAIRLKIWDCCLDVVKNNWVVGVGTGDAQSVLDNNYAKRNYQFAMATTYNAHNQYLQEAVTSGIIGLIILILCIVVPLFDKGNTWNYNLYFIFLILFIVSCTTESLLQMNKGIIWYSFFNALFAFTKDTDKVPA